MFRAISKILLALVPLTIAPVWAGAAPVEKRIALVIGNTSYHTRPLATPANDAGLVSQALRASGFNVVGARDLDGASMRGLFRDVLDSASRAQPDAVVVLYFAGYGLQLGGENYLLPVDADISSDADLPAQGLQVSAFISSLAALHVRAAVVFLDAARANPFSLSGQPLAGGLAWPEFAPNIVMAFNAAPGTVAPDDPGAYGAYAKALAEIIREGGGLAISDMLRLLRLRVEQTTNGGQVPWDASGTQTPLVLFERDPLAATPTGSLEKVLSLRTRPMLELSPQDAYSAALLRDTFDGYADFLAAYGRDPMAKRIRALLAARREAITWLRTHQANTPEAYWSYLSRYPWGPHTGDSRRGLNLLSAPTEPPSKFAMLEYDMPPPQSGEREYFEQPVLTLDNPHFEFPPPPAVMEAPRPEFAMLKPPLPTPAKQPHALSAPDAKAPTDAIAPSRAVSSSSNSMAPNHATIAATPETQPETQSPPLTSTPPPKATDGGASPEITQSVPSIAPKTALTTPQILLSTADPRHTGSIGSPLSQPLPALSPTHQEPAADQETLSPAMPPPTTTSVPLPVPRPTTDTPSAAAQIPLPLPRPPASRSVKPSTNANRTADHPTQPDTILGLPRSLFGASSH